MAKFCNKCGKPLVDGKCDCQGGGVLDNVQDVLFPSEIALCDEEVVIKTYHCAFLRTKFLMRTVAHGFLAITNKRVVYHTVPIKKKADFMHNETLIEDVSGVSLSKGKMMFPSIIFANAMSLLMGLVLAVWLVPTIFAAMFKTDPKPLITIFCLIYLAIIAWFIYKNRGSLMARFGSVGGCVVGCIELFFDWLLGKRTALMFTVVSKGGAAGPVNLSNLAILKQAGGWDISAYPDPLENIHEISKEIGTIINDIQKTGTTSLV